MSRLVQWPATPLILPLSGALALCAGLLTCRLAAQEHTAPAASTNLLHRISVPGVKNGYQLTPRIYSGSQPEGEAAFEALARLGVKTIVSVDGAPPDVAAARRHGLRYIHVPVGYDGIATNEALLLAQSAVTVPGPIFVHCHHGKHRGPTAAALICEAAEAWSPAQADAWLLQAGTSSDYPGLYRAVRETSFPPKTQLASRTNALPEVCAPQGIVAAMVEMDQLWQDLLAVQEAGYRAPSDHPDLSPTHTATRLRRILQAFTELAETRQHGADFQRLATEATAAAASLQAAIQRHADSPSKPLTNLLVESYRAMSQSCVACHKAHRNQGIQPR